MVIRVLVADDQPLMRMALRSSLQAEADIEVVGEAHDGGEAVRLAARLRPAVVVMDIRMPVLDGIAAARRIIEHRACPPARVLMMTTFDLDEYIVEALRAGARGFLLKEATPDEFVHAVRVLAAGDAYLSPAVTGRLLDLRGTTLRPVRSPAEDGPLRGLTPRELAVLKLVARGLSNAEIGSALQLAPSSVKTHVGHLLAKLGFTDRVQLVVFAYEQELVRPGWPDDRPQAPAGQA